MLDLQNKLTTLHEFNMSAIRLKELFDKDGSNSSIRVGFQNFEANFLRVRKVVSIELIRKGDLLRHVDFLSRYIQKDNPQGAYSDICDICYKDIGNLQTEIIKETSLSPRNKNVEKIESQINLLHQRDNDGPSWLFATEILLKAIFPEEVVALQKHRIIGPNFNFTPDEIKRFEGVLKAYILKLEESDNSVNNDQWINIHESIKNVAKDRFESAQFADAVEASFKEINQQVKKEYKNSFSIELDGDALMRKCFSMNNTLFVFDDLSTENGRNIQQGYMDIFAGSIKGIRNPKAHSNLIIDKIDAWEKIVLASHLMKMWDQAKNNKKLK